MFDPTKLAHRDMELRAVDGEKREIVGIGVPFDSEFKAYGFTESFDAACEFVDIERAKFFMGHTTVIGRVVAHERTDAGLRITARASKTAPGDEALALALDGTLDRFSIGFRPLEWRETEEGTIVHTKVRVMEFSLVAFPAYDSATVEQVRSTPTPPPNQGDPTMPETITRAELETMLQTREADLTRSWETSMATMAGNAAAAAPLGDQWRNAGEFLKAIASGDSAATDFHRAYTGGEFADSAPRATWIRDSIHLIDQRRATINAFTRETLGPDGMSVDYVQLKSSTIVVAKQAAEGDPLPFGKIALEAKSAPIRTYGGAAQLSRQVIERGSTPMLTTTLRALDLAYAKTTETAIKTLLLATITDQIAAGNKITLSAAASESFDWIDLVIDAAELADDRGFALAGLKVSKDVFKRIARLETSGGEPLMTVQGQGINQVGTINATELTGSLATVTVSMIAGAPANTATFFDPVALTTWESAGAPVQLQDENIINLTKDYSKYGFLAAAAEFPTALIPVEFGA